jgi:PAS domain-containing protein
MVTDTPVRDEQGELKGIIGVSMDISERKESEEVLRGAHRRTEDTLESITDAFYAVDHQWRFTYINERALHYMQAFKNDSELTREELLGKDVWAVFPEAVSTVFYDIYHEAMRERKVVDLE